VLNPTTSAGSFPAERAARALPCPSSTWSPAPFPPSLSTTPYFSPVCPAWPSASRSVHRLRVLFRPSLSVALVVFASHGLRLIQSAMSLRPSLNTCCRAPGSTLPTRVPVMGAARTEDRRPAEFPKLAMASRDVRRSGRPMRSREGLGAAAPSSGWRRDGGQGAARRRRPRRPRLRQPPAATSIVSCPSIIIFWAQRTWAVG
jgi:hypothetical protein